MTYVEWVRLLAPAPDGGLGALQRILLGEARALDLANATDELMGRADGLRPGVRDGALTLAQRMLRYRVQYSKTYKNIPTWFPPPGVTEDDMLVLEMMES